MENEKVDAEAVVSDTTTTAPLEAKSKLAPKSKVATYRDWFLTIGAILAILIPIWFMGAAVGTKFHLWDWRFGLLTMIRLVGPILIFAALILGVIGALLMLFARPFGGLKRALIALIIPGIAFSQLMSFKAKAALIPPIHDIATDPAAPPQFSAHALSRRTAQGETNPITPPTSTMIPAATSKPTKFSGLSVADAQKLAYPNIKPLIISGKSVSEVAEIVKDTEKRFGWKTASLNEAVANDGTSADSYLLLNTRATTFWFGFVDDVAISVRPQGNDVRVDMRSNSRVGVSDLGANAKRIEDFLKAVQSKAN